MTMTAPPLARLGTRPRIVDYLRSMWERREFATAIPRAELQAQHRNTVLGSLWHLLDPFIQVAVYWLVFAKILGVTRGVDNIVGFLAIGVFMWHFTTKAVKSGAKSITSNEGLVRAISFPRAILPLTAVLAEFFAFGFAMVAMFVAVLITGEVPGWTWLLIVPLVGIQLVFNLGFGLLFARVADHFRDILQVLPYTLRIIGYMSGVLFPIERRLRNLPELRGVMDYNPAYLFMKTARAAILDNAAPTPREWGVMAIWAVGALLVGFLFFLGREHEYGRA
ncbi:MAG: ABC transporter permease [Nitriliruptorales bacterium]|nr:ABC transporter permease [Nitriliruptorales bacterium]